MSWRSRNCMEPTQLTSSTESFPGSRRRPPTSAGPRRSGLRRRAMSAALHRRRLRSVRRCRPRTGAGARAGVRGAAARPCSAGRGRRCGHHPAKLLRPGPSTRCCVDFTAGDPDAGTSAGPARRFGCAHAAVAFRPPFRRPGHPRRGRLPVRHRIRHPSAPRWRMGGQGAEGIATRTAIGGHGGRRPEGTEMNVATPSDGRHPPASASRSVPLPGASSARLASPVTRPAVAHRAGPRGRSRARRTRRARPRPRPIPWA